MLSILSTLLIILPLQQSIQFSTISSGGVSSQAKGKYISHVVGQASVVSGTVVSQKVKVRQGFKQPNFMLKSIKRSGLSINLEEKNPITYKVFPNPFKNKLTIQLSEQSESPTFVTLYDQTANVIFEAHYPEKINEIVLDKFENVKVGVYVLTIVYKGKPFTANLVKEVE